MLSVRWIDRPTEETLAPFAQLWNDFTREVIPGEPDTPVEKLVAEVRDVAEHRRVEVCEARDGDVTVGAAELVFDDVVGRESVAWVKLLVVDAPHRRRGVGTLLFDALVERAREEQRERLQTFIPTTHAPGGAFAAARGARTGIVMRQSRVATADLDLGLLQRWVDKAQERAHEYSLVRFDGRCPDEWLGQFADLVSVMNTAPRSEEQDEVFLSAQEVRDQEEAHLRAGGWGWTVCAVHKPSGQLIGFTELGGLAFRVWLADQGDTAVRPDHRNRGIGRWLKAVNALRLVRERPAVAVIESWNANENAPMLSINQAMGFRPVLDWQEWTRPTDP